MTITKVNWLADLEALARGDKVKTPVEILAECALPWVRAGLATDELAKLELLFRLADPRPR